ncbi:MAG: iron ABC transporter permease [Halanaerobiales bacterium]|nr:iron ABC transporter permease [Halanaerobiales bacterium]
MDFINKKTTRYATVLLILLALLIFAFLLNIGMGSVKIPISQVFTEIKRMILHQQSDQPIYKAIIGRIRLPRTLAAIIGGASLASAGLLLQIFFRNPLVGPYVLGISSGATLLVALILLAGVTFGLNIATPFLLFLAAFIGSILVMTIVLLISSKVKNVVTLLVIGLMAGYLCGSVTSFLMAFAEKEEVKGFIMWTMGSFSGFTWKQVTILTLVGLPGLFITLLISKPLNALLMGEKYAASMGVKIKRIRFLIVLISSLLAGLVTAFAGPVSFIGLSVPHISRLCFGTSDNKILIPGTILLGGTITGLCDLIARTIFAPVEVPISAVTSFLGAPVVIFLLLRRRNAL